MKIGITRPDWVLGQLGVSVALTYVCFGMFYRGEALGFARHCENEFLR